MAVLKMYKAIKPVPVPKMYVVITPARKMYRAVVPEPKELLMEAKRKPPNGIILLVYLRI